MKIIYYSFDLHKNEILLVKDKSKLPKKHTTLDKRVFYDENTSLCFINILPQSKINNIINVEEECLYTMRKNFLSCRFKYSEDFFKDSNLAAFNRTLMKEDENKSLVHWRKQKLSFVDGAARIAIDLQSANYDFIALKKRWVSLSGVEIENKGTFITLCKDKKLIDLSTALKNYFKTSLTNLELAHAYLGWACEKRSDSSFSECLQPELLRLNNPLLDDTDFNLLKESKILAVWCLIPVVIEENGVKKTIESQMIGLAEDKEGHLFHWVTDLEQDISVLMDYAPDISSSMQSTSNNIESKGSEQPPAKRLKTE